MGRIDLIAGDWHAALAALDWQVDLGVDAAVQDAPVNRYEAVEHPPARAGMPGTAAVAPAPDRTVPPAPAVSPGQSASLATRVDTVAEAVAEAVAAAVAAASRATSLAELRDALAVYPHCDIRKGARNLVFAAGLPGARVMVVGDAPDIDDDRQGMPFAGAKGGLLDRMFAAIGLARDAADPDRALYLTSVLPWKAPGASAPDAADIAMIRPFLMRHIALARPAFIVAMGTEAARALMPEAPVPRGAWGQVLGTPVLAMQHPAALLRIPAQKREAWADLLALKARMTAQEGKMNEPD